MRLSDLINPDAVVPDLAARDRNAALREMVVALTGAGSIDPKDAEVIVQAAITRENNGSTGFGKGVAVPHVKHSCIERMVATIGRSSHGIDFAALDRGPVFTILMLLSPVDSPEDHLAAMERIFRYLQQEKFRRFLRQADTREAIVALIHETDDLHD